MKTTTAGEFSQICNATLSFKSLTIDELTSSLPAFYLKLDFDARRARFAGAVSDDAILRHCRQIDPATSLVLACSARAFMNCHPGPQPSRSITIAPTRN